MILLTYGQPKSASTYLAELSRRACAVAGSDQKALRERCLAPLPNVSGAFWDGALTALPSVAGRMAPGEALSIKTHSPPCPSVGDMIEEERLHVLISYRHPGDAALSMFEAGAKARAEGDDRQPAFSRLMTHREAIDATIRHVRHILLPWLRSGHGEALSFDRLVNEADAVVPLLAAAVGVAPERLAADPGITNLVSGRKRVYNFNRGEAGRYRDAFSGADRAYLAEELGPFIAFCEGRCRRDDL